MSCIWWKSISGSTATLACAPKSTEAMGSPAARDFLEPANVIATRSARSKPSLRDPYQLTVSITASSTASTPTSATSRPGLTALQTPSFMPWLKAV
ncbi:hypothetical protein GCM10009801_65210 [Streptomyces albiaxialis]|uniref:Uncharacterized protein n=1 Tax=Streptomyces albiaxialis TaxID=329523 RepID=A0ABN2WNA1_9ACTN